MLFVVLFSILCVNCFAIDSQGSDVPFILCFSYLFHNNALAIGMTKKFTQIITVAFIILLFKYRTNTLD